MPLYTYAKLLSAFPNGKVALPKLRLEIGESPITAALDESTNVSGTDVNIIFKAALSGPEEIALDQVVAAHDGEPLPDATNLDGSLNVQVVNTPGFYSRKEPGDELIVTTPDYANPSSWYQQAQKVTETLVLTTTHGITNLPDVVSPQAGESLANYTVYASPTNQLWWIDTTHGKLLNEEAIVAADVAQGSPRNGWACEVRVDGVLQPQAAPFEEHQWGDPAVKCWVWFEKGLVIFKDAPSQAPQVTYWHANGSLWTLAPLPGKRIEVEKVTAMFSVSAMLRDTFDYSVWAGNGAQQVGQRIYATKRQILQDAYGTFPIIKGATPDPAVRGPYQRADLQDVEEIPFRYEYSRELDSTLGVDLRMRLLNDVPVLAETAVVTFYCKSKDAA